MCTASPSCAVLFLGETLCSVWKMVQGLLAIMNLQFKKNSEQNLLQSVYSTLVIVSILKCHSLYNWLHTVIAKIHVRIGTIVTRSVYFSLFFGHAECWECYSSPFKSIHMPLRFCLMLFV